MSDFDNVIDLSFDERDVELMKRVSDFINHLIDLFEAEDDSDTIGYTTLEYCEGSWFLLGHYRFNRMAKERYKLVDNAWKGKY